MKKKMYLMSCLVMLVALVFTGCKVKDEKKENKDEVKQEQDGIVYSNLVDEKTQNEVAGYLKEAGVSDDRVSLFLDWVKEMNGNIKTASAFHDGFTSAGSNQVNYDDVTLVNYEGPDGNVITDMNCRLTAYLLYGQFMNATELKEDYDPFLMFDVEAIDQEERFASFRDNKNKFITIFDPVKVKEGSTLEEHMEAIQKAWKERGITMEDNGNISLVTLYLHDTLDNLRFIGHTGVLLKQEDGLMFVEKYGWNMPFQCTKFDNEEELVRYVLDRNDLYGDGSEEPVIVMKNDKVISGEVK